MSLINGRDEGNWHHIKHPKDLDCFSFKVSKKYTGLSFVGSGRFGVVCKALNTKTNTIVAIKKIELNNKYPRIIMALREVQISKILSKKSKAVIELLDIEIPAIRNNENWEFNNVYLVYEYMPSNLHKEIRSQTNKLEDQDYRRLLANMLYGLRDLHHVNILHRDIKPSNLLVDRDAKGLKISDFGLARAMKTFRPEGAVWKSYFGLNGYSSDDDSKEWESYFGLNNLTSDDDSKEWKSYSMMEEVQINNLTNELGTLGYRSPEQTLGCQVYQKASCIFAVGCVFAEMVNKTKFFNVETGASNFEQFHQIIKKFGSSYITGNLQFIDNKEGLKQAMKEREGSIIGTSLFEEFVGKLHPDGINLLKKLLRFDPYKRISAQNALKTAYLKGTHATLEDKFPHLEIEKQLEKDEEGKLSQEAVKQRIWTEMLEFHGYNKRAAEADESTVNKLQKLT